MGTYKRLPRGRKKQSNEFISFAEKSYAWFLTNWRSVAIGAGVIVLLIGAIVGGYRYVGWREHKAALALERSHEMRDDAQRTDALHAVADDYRGTAAAREALVMLGKDELKQKRYDEALSSFSALVEQSRGYPIFQVYGLHQKGRIYEDKKAWADAAQTYADAADIKGNLIRSESMYRQARSLEGMGDYARAQSIYGNLIDDGTDTDAAIKAKSEERLLWLRAHQLVAQQ